MVRDFYYGYHQEDLLFIQALLKGVKLPCAAEDALGSMILVEQMKKNEIHAN